VEIFELFFASTNGSIIGLKQSPNGGFKAVREAVYLPTDVRDCLIMAQESAMEALRGDTALAGRRTAQRKVARLLTRPTAAEARCLGDIPHQEGFGGQGRLEQLARPQYSLGGYMLHPLRLIWDLRKTFWRRGFVTRLFSR
jgi:hypothetical protein